MRSHGGLVGALAIAMLLCCAGPARAQTNVTFPDPNLEAAVRSALGKPTGALTPADLGTLTTERKQTKQIKRETRGQIFTTAKRDAARPTQQRNISAWSLAPSHNNVGAYQNR